MSLPPLRIIRLCAVPADRHRLVTEVCLKDPCFRQDSRFKIQDSRVTCFDEMTHAIRHLDAGEAYNALNSYQRVKEPNTGVGQEFRMCLLLRRSENR